MDPIAEREARVRRERAFHDARFTDESRQAANKYYEVDTGTVQYAGLIRTRARGSVVLEYGCGTGSSALGLAAQGATVVGIDVSAVGVADASRSAAAEGAPAYFAQMDAERLALAPRSFDLVCGSGILHHLDIDAAVDEVRRVLRPGGEAVFYEPMGTNPLINIYRRLTPSMRTPDEHPLVPRDFERMHSGFADVRVHYHDFLTLGGVVLQRVPGLGTRLVRILQAVDSWLFRKIPWTTRWAWVAVIHLRSPCPGDDARCRNIAT